MDRHILICRKDVECSDQVSSWVKDLFPEVVDSTTNKVDDKLLLKWIPVSRSFDKVCCPLTLCEWVDRNTLLECLGDKTTLLGNDDVSTQDLETFLQDTADSIPAIGCSVQMYVFLHADDLDTESSFIAMAGSIFRFTKWLHVRMFIVKMESELPALGKELVNFTSGKVVSITDSPQLTPLSWTGEVSVTDQVNKDGIVFPGFYIFHEQWDKMLKQIHPPRPPVILEKPIKRSRGRKEQVNTTQPDDSQIVCGHSIEVLQEIDLATFPLFLLTTWNFNLLRFNGNGNLVEYFHDKKRTGLVARLRVYKINGQIPLCGDISHLSTLAWRDFIIKGSPDGHVNHLPCPYEYLHLLIIPDPALAKQSSTSSPSASSSSSKRSEQFCFQVRVISTATNLARNILSIAKRSSMESLDGGRGGTRKQGENSSKKKGKTAKDETQDQPWIKSLPVFQAEDFLTSVQAISRSQKEAKGKQDAESSDIEDILQEMRNNGRALGDCLETPEDVQEWKSEVAFGLSECPEWKALVSESTRGHNSKTDISTGSARTTCMKQKYFDAAGPKDLILDQIISLFKDDKNNTTGSKLDTYTFGKRSSDSVSPGLDINKRHDIYHYNTEEDYDCEARYAQIRDQVGFQDTLSSFLTPKKKISKPFRTVMPTRSSPRTKLFTRKSHSPPSSSSRSESLKSTFKHPQSFHTSSDSNQRKRPHSSLTHESPLPSFSHSQRNSSSSIGSSQGQGHKRLSSSLTPTITQSRSAHNSATSSSESHRKYIDSQRNLSQQSSNSSSNCLYRKRPVSASFTPETESNRPFKFARTKTPSPLPSSSLSFDKSRFEQGSEMSPVSSKGSSTPSYKRVPFTTVLDMPESGVRRSPRKLTKSQPAFDKAMKSAKPADTSQSQRNDRVGPSPSYNDDSKQGTQSTSLDKKAKMKRSERHMMRLKDIIARVLMEKGVNKDDPIYQACSKNLLNVSIVLLKSLPNSLNLTDEMKSVVYGQVQQIINLEKRRSGIAL